MKRSGFRGLFVIAVAVLVLWWASGSSSALIRVARGNDPIGNRGWPLGSEEVANLPARIGFRVGPPFGGGEYHFLYRCADSAEFNEALETFSEIRVPRYVRDSAVSDSGEILYRAESSPLVLVVHDGPGRSVAFGSEEQFDWTFTVWVPASWHRLRNDPRSTFSADTPGFRQPVPRPQIDAYVSGGSIVWEQVKVPANVRVIDRRAGSAPVGMAGGGVVRGEVYDMATGQPIAGAEIALATRKGAGDHEGPAGATTDWVGAAQLGGVPEGSYEIHVRAEGYAPRRAGYYRNTGNSYYEFSAELVHAASVSGTVKDPDGAPIPGVEVRARNTLGMDGLGYAGPTDEPATTDQQGRFELRLLPDGFTGIRCRAPSLHQETFIFELYQVPSEDIRIVMIGTGIVRGRAVGPDGEAPAGEVHVHIQPPGPSRIGTWGGSMKCKGDGSFEFKGVPPGQYLLSTDPLLGIEGDPAGAVPVTVVAGRTVDVEVPDLRADRAHQPRRRSLP